MCCVIIIMPHHSGCDKRERDGGGASCGLPCRYRLLRAGVIGVFAVTDAAESSLHLPGRAESRPIRSTNSKRSWIRKKERPAATATNGSELAMLVHAVVRDRRRPPPSLNSTRSPPQFLQRETRRNHWPCSGWKGWVTSNARAPSWRSCAVDGVLEAPGPDARRHPGDRRAPAGRGAGRHGRPGRADRAWLAPGG